MRVLRPSTASATTSPPLPPSPPFGPPNSMNFSRRNDTQPFPPSPERTYTLASSRNFMPHDMRSRAQNTRAARGASRARGNQGIGFELGDGEVSVGRGQGGPCLTDAAQ